MSLIFSIEQDFLRLIKRDVPLVKKTKYLKSQKIKSYSAETKRDVLCCAALSGLDNQDESSLVNDINSYE